MLPPEPRLRDLFDALGERASGMVLAVIAIPAVVPSPGLPVGLVFGVALVLIAMGMVLGAARPRLPTWLGRIRLKRKVISLLESRGANLLQRVERYLRPRASGFLAVPLVRLLGLVSGFMGVLIALPIPFGNTLPGLSVLLMGLGLVAAMAWPFSCPLSWQPWRRASRLRSAGQATGPQPACSRSEGTRPLPKGRKATRGSFITERPGRTAA
jgi:hypothetical protein